MKRLRLKADPWNEWIYDTKHPDYHSKQAEHMRRARGYAIQNAPEWMKYDAYITELAIQDMKRR